MAETETKIDTLEKLPNSDIGYVLFRLMEALKAIDEETNLAELNETSISDNNGGRIQLWYDPLNVRMLAWTKTKKQL